ncbi:M48 family metallopeptidase [bacterium]|nr:M48 family metallopeptidase [bacterium]MBU1990358.1 M48 family metallopeptidase [bacterium]
MNSNIVFNGLTIEHIVKKGIKNSYISVKPILNEELNHSKIILKTPLVSQSFIQNLLQEKESWIRKQLLKVQKNPPKKINLEDEVELFGEIYSIDTDEAFLLRERLEKIKTTNETKILRCYDEFYKQYAKNYLEPRLEYFSNIMCLPYNEVKFKKMRSRWGSCSSLRVITLNTELIKVKKEFIDYVLVHELAHLVHMNHSKSFHDLVDKYIKNSKLIRKEIKNTRVF